MEAVPLACSPNHLGAQFHSVPFQTRATFLPVAELTYIFARSDRSSGSRAAPGGTRTRHTCGKRCGRSGGRGASRSTTPHRTGGGTPSRPRGAHSEPGAAGRGRRGAAERRVSAAAGRRGGCSWRGWARSRGGLCTRRCRRAAFGARGPASA